MSACIQKEFRDNIKVKKSANVQLICVYVYALTGIAALITCLILLFTVVGPGRNKF